MHRYPPAPAAVDCRICEGSGENAHGSKCVCTYNKDRPPAPGFRNWAPLQLAHALGLRIDLRNAGGGMRTAYVIGAGGKAHPMGHTQACNVLARLARRQGVNPTAPPRRFARALINGQDQGELFQL